MERHEANAEIFLGGGSEAPVALTVVQGFKELDGNRALK